MKNRITPIMINALNNNEVFVFGSNYPKGIHGAGAARKAFKDFGAKYGIGYGLQGQSFAIPTKDSNIQTMPLEMIKEYVNDFITFAKDRPELIFLVTEIGCGLAGLTPQQVAPMFKGAVDVVNIHLPERFWNELSPVKTIALDIVSVKPYDDSSMSFPSLKNEINEDDGTIKHFQD